MIALLLLWQIESSVGRLPLPAIVGTSGESRTYHGVTVAGLKETQWTHVSACGRVALVKHESDGDGHIRIEAGGAFLIAEVVPYHQFPLPKVGQYVRVAGISREDRTHHWFEINPVEAISVVNMCAM